MVVYIDRTRADAAVEFSHLRGVVLGGGGIKWGGWNSCLLPPAFLRSLSLCCFLSSLSLCSVPWNFTAQILTQQDNNLPRSLSREKIESVESSIGKSSRHLKGISSSRLLFNQKEFILRA